jgi:hypothetical protein
MVNTLKNKQVYHNILFKNKNILSNRTEEQNYKIINLDPNELIIFEYDLRENNMISKILQIITITISF